MRDDHESVLVALVLNDDAAVASTLGARAVHAEDAMLDAKTRALVRLAAVIALESTDTSFDRFVSVALAAGATDAEVVSVLVAVAPVAGLARLNSAAAGLARSLGLATALGDA